MKSTKITILLTVLSTVIAPLKALFAYSNANTAEEKATCVASYTDNLTIRFLTALVVVSTLASSLFAQSISTDESQIKASQSPEAIATVLKDAEKSGSLLDATIELSIPTAAYALEHVALSGQIRSIFVISTTSDWKGAIYSTPKSPITSLADGLHSYEQLYRNAGPGDPFAYFEMTAFTVRGSASDISRARDFIPGANLVSVAEVSKPTRIQSRKSTSAKNDSASEASTQASTNSAPASTTTAFAPSRAELNIQTLPNSDRRIDVTFSWNTSDDLAGLSYDRSSLEIQVLFWNHAADAQTNNITYVGSLKTWGTDTISHAYFDTPALNGTGFAGSPYEREVTIGSFDARSDFQAGRQYRVWAVTERGVLDANFAKLSFQRGIYKPTIRQNAGVYTYCQLHGGSDPASCVAGLDTAKVTPVNYTGTNYSIVAPSIPPFTYPNQTCSIPPGYPYLGEGKGPSSVTEPMAYNQGLRILRFQRAFTINGSRRSVGCPTNSTHQDTVWWPRGGHTQDFVGSLTGKGAGAIMLAPGASRAFWVHGAIWARYSSMGGPKSVVGEPTGDEQSVTSSRGSNGAYQGFTRGWLYFNGPKNRTYYVVNAIAQKYRSVGLHTDQLGFPTSDEYPWNVGARSDFEGGYIYWNAAEGAVIVRNQPGSLPTVGGYSWSTTPTAGQPFSGTVTGTGFVVGGTKVFFCINGSTTCYQHPSAGVTVNSATNLTVTNANLSAGSWQIYVQTSAGSSARSAVFTVQTSMSRPTIGGYSWNTTPISNQPFGGTITGTNFVSGGTQVWFCVSGTSTCYQHPSAGITVNNSTSISVSNVNLSAGSWQVYVQTAAGASARSTPFTVQAPASPPTISGYFWNTTPIANQQFGGTITGTGFVPGGTQVWFCISGSSTCYQHPSAGVTVNSSTILSVSNVNLGYGSWQIYIKTSVGQSARSAGFTVQAAAPTISGYFWNSTPTGNQPFSGTITGTNFVSGGTQVWFCISGTSTCYQHPSVGVNVNITTSLSVSNVALSTGSWQTYVQTSVGQSARSTTFTVW